VDRQKDRVDETRFGSLPVFAKKKTELPALKLSPHSIALYRECKLQYKFHCIDKLSEKYGRARPYYTMANHVHATLHDLLSVVPLKNRTLETAERLLDKNWQRYRVGFRNRADEKRWAQRAREEVTRFVLEQDLTITPVMLEKPIEAEITPGLILRGRVDRVDRQPDASLHVKDYKTGILPENIDWTQLELHALTLSRGGHNPVSKASYLYLLTGTMHTRQLDREALDQTAWELLRIAEEIRREKDYPPQPGPACGGCDFAVICPAKDKGYVQMGEVDLPLWRDFSDILLEE
jgi:putative RecB family exonuclease